MLELPCDLIPCFILLAYSKHPSIQFLGLNNLVTIGISFSRFLNNVPMLMAKYEVTLVGPFH